MGGFSFYNRLVILHSKLLILKLMGSLLTKKLLSFGYTVIVILIFRLKISQLIASNTYMITLDILKEYKRSTILIFLLIRVSINKLYIFKALNRNLYQTATILAIAKLCRKTWLVIILMEEFIDFKV